MSGAAFLYEVFLSHSAKEKTVVYPLAKRSHAGGLLPLAFSLQPFLDSLAQFHFTNWPLKNPDGKTRKNLEAVAARHSGV